MNKIVVTDCSWNCYEVEKKHLPKNAEIVCTQVTSADAVVEACRGAVAVMSEYADFSRKVMEQLPDLKIIANSTIGVDNIDLEAAKDLGISVANVPNYCVHEVAEHAMALIAALLRNIVWYDRKVSQKIWDISGGPTLYRMSDLTLGLIGCGQIPRRVAKMAQGFEMEVLGHDPYLPEELAKQCGIRLVSLDELCEKSDAILAHVPLTDSTENLINKAVFDKMKKQPVFVNTARGGIVDQKALCAALKSGQLKGAGLDVLVDEPPDFENDEIFTFDNVIFTPHAAFYSETALEEVRRRSAENVTNFLQGNFDKVDFLVRNTER